MQRITTNDSHHFLTKALLAFATLLPIASAQDSKPPTQAGAAIAKIVATIPNVEPLIQSPWTQSWLQTAKKLTPIEPKIIRWNEQDLTVDEALVYSARFGSPLAYARPLDLAEQHGFHPAPNTRILDFGYGSIGHLDMLALAGLHAVGVDVAPILPAIYPDGSRNLASGSIKLLNGRFPADPQITTDIGEGYDLFLSKNTLKRGYIHPSREVDNPKKLIQLGVDDKTFLQAIHQLLKPGGLIVLYNFCPAQAPIDQPYIPWADGLSPFSQAEFEACNFEVLAISQPDHEPARQLAHALGWDAEGGMNLDQDLFAWYTIARRKPNP